jgi:chemotaxis protein CheY-P-specific phosphatase CheC
MKKSQSRMWKTQNGELQFVISIAETQNVLGKFAGSKVYFVILNVDLVASTKLPMTLPLDRLTRLIQSFNQEMGSATLFLTKTQASNVSGYIFLF